MGAKRALSRWGWRLLRNEWRQQFLILTLIVLSLTAASVLATLGFHAEQPASTFAGSATHRLYLNPDDEEDLASQLDRLAAVFDEAEVTLTSYGRRDGSDVEIPIEALPTTLVFGSEPVRLLAGHLPDEPAELAVSTQTAAAARLTLGNSVSIEGSDYTIVGLVEDPSILNRTFALVSELSASEASAAQALVRATPQQLNEFNAGDNGLVDFSNTEQLQIGSGSRAVPLAVSLTLTAVVLLEIALLCSAGFIVLAQRRTRQFGLMAAVGASPKHLRTALRLNGLILGLLGGALGTSVGFALSLAARPLFEQLLNQRISTWSMPWVILVPLVLMAGATGLLAAWWPARALTKLSTVDALAARPSSAPSTARWLWFGIPSMLGGSIVLAVAADTNHGKAAVVALLVTLGGLLASTPAIAVASGRLASRLPVGPRIALRDIARHPNRSAAALASLVVALTIPCAITLISASGDVESERSGPNLPDNWAVVMPDGGSGGHLQSSSGSKNTAELEAITTILPDAIVVAIYMPAAESSPHAAFVGHCVGDEQEMSCFSQSGDQPWVATSELFDALGLDPALADSDARLLSNRTGAVTLQVGDGPRPGEIKPEVVELGPFSTVPNYFVPEAALADAGLVAVRTGWLFVNPTPITGDMTSQLLAAVSNTGERGRTDRGALHVQVRQPPQDDSDIRQVTAIVGAVLALAVIASMTALLRVDSEAVDATLATVGASDRTRRGITASTTAFLAFVGAALALPGGYLMLLAVSSAQSQTFPFVTPTPGLVALLIGTPAVATLISALVVPGHTRSV